MFERFERASLKVEPAMREQILLNNGSDYMFYVDTDSVTHGFFYSFEQESGMTGATFIKVLAYHSLK